MTRISEYFRDWMNVYKKGQVRSSTFGRYEHARQNLEAHFPDVSLEEATRRDYQEWINRLAGRYELTTVSGIHRLVRACLRDAVYDGVIEKDPSYGARVHGRLGREKTKWLNRDEAEALLGVLDPRGSGMDAGIAVCLRTGLRISELLGLTPESWDGVKLSVTRTYDYKNHKARRPVGFTAFERTKNKSSVRSIAVDPETAAILDHWSRETPPGESIFARHHVDNGAWRLHLKSHCVRVGVPPVSTHALRHTHASLLIAAGVSVQSIAKRLGHANTITTQKTYIHLIRELEDQDNAKVVQVMGGLGVTS